MKEMDAFLLAYRTHPTESDLSNSHKILEYLSTGRVVISSPLTEYGALAQDVIRFVPNNDISDFQIGFSEILSQLERFNSAELLLARRNIARANTYSHHWENIFARLMEVKPKI